MSPLEKAARALKMRLNHSGRLDYKEAARAVISSIEPDDAMLAAAYKAGDDAYLFAANDETALHDAFCAALKAALRDLAERGE